MIENLLVHVNTFFEFPTSRASARIVALARVNSHARYRARKVGKNQPVLNFLFPFQ